MLKRTIQTCGLSLLLLGLAAGPATVQAEKISIGRQGAGAQGLERPRTGQTMQAVENRFGSPASMHGPVGDPPITVWEYSQYTVYFEYNHVIHTVIKPQ